MRFTSTLASVVCCCLTLAVGDVRAQTATRPGTTTTVTKTKPPATTTKVDPARTTTPERKEAESRKEAEPDPAETAKTRTPTADQARVAASRSRQQVETAQIARAKGGYQEAVTVYEEALRDAPPTDGATRAHVSIAYAQTLEAWTRAEGKTDPADAERLTKASQLYRSAVDVGTPPQRQLARNNLGLLQMRQGQYAEALETLQQLDTAAEPERRFLYEYNIGRALELSGRQSDAFDRYLTAVNAQPAFAPAHEAALQVVLAERPLKIERAETLANALISRGQPAAGANVLRATLRAGGDDGRDRLLRGLMRAYVGMSIEPAAFEREEAPFLSSLPQSRPAREIERAVVDQDLPLITYAYEADRIFPYWSDREGTEFAALLKHIADKYNRQEKIPQALARYGAAWAMDRGNGESAVYAAMLLQDHPKLDPDGRVLNLLLEDVFAAKSAARARRDWPNSLRLHLVLGTIFERLGRWGPENEPRTAAFQWRAALEAEQRVLQQDKTFTRSPGLYMRLGEAYLRLTPPKPLQARDQFLNAAKAFEDTGRTEDAENARKRATAATSTQHD